MPYGMAAGVVIVIGNLATERPWFGELARTFGWRYREVKSLDALRETSAEKIVAVFFNAALLDMPWKDCLAWIHSVTPEALCILCRQFTESIDVRSLSSWGAFHEVPLPLEFSEVRQSLGFVAAARRQQTFKSGQNPQVAL
jgi:hypothetical protein